MDFIAVTNIDRGYDKIATGARFRAKDEAEAEMLRKLGCVQDAPTITAEPLVLGEAEATEADLAPKRRPGRPRKAEDDVI